MKEVDQDIRTFDIKVGFFCFGLLVCFFAYEHVLDNIGAHFEADEFIVA